MGLREAPNRLVVGFFVIVISLTGFTFATYLNWTFLYDSTISHALELRVQTATVEAATPSFDYNSRKSTNFGEKFSSLSHVLEYSPEKRRLLDSVADIVRSIENNDEHWEEDAKEFFDLVSAMEVSNDVTPTRVDVLDDMCVLEGHTMAALSIEDAKICDTEFQSVLKSSWKCPEDPTCKECRREVMARFSEIQDAFRNEATQKARLNQIRNKFSKDKPVVVSAVNHGQLFLFMNWVCSCERIGLKARDFTYIVPADEQAYEILEREGFHVPNKEYLKLLSFEINSKYRGAANMGGHADINNLLLLATVDFVQLGYHTLLHDVDIAWKDNPFPYLMNAVERRDFVAMLAPRFDAQGPVNSGFVFINPTRKSKMLMKTLENVSGLKKKRDQILWNTVIRLPQMQGQLEWRILPKQLFRKTGISKSLKLEAQQMAKKKFPPVCNNNRAIADRDNYFVFHAVGNAKKDVLIKNHHWFYVNGTCLKTPCTESC